MSHWLVKQEPSSYPFSQLLKDKKVVWDGVRNYQARNFLRQMKLGDPVLYYHSVDQRAIVGLAKITKIAFPDPTSPQGEEWTSVVLSAVHARSTEGRQEIFRTPSSPPIPSLRYAHPCKPFFHHRSTGNLNPPHSSITPRLHLRPLRLLELS